MRTKHFRLLEFPVADQPDQSVWNNMKTSWRHQKETFSALLALCAENSPVTGEFSSQRPVTRSFDVFFDLHLNKRLRKQSWGLWLETPSHSLWRHCNIQALWGENPFTKGQWIPLKSVSDAELWFSLCCYSKQTVEHTIKSSFYWYESLWRSCDTVVMISQVNLDQTKCASFWK